MVGRAGVAASLSLARIEGSRSRRRRSVVPLCPFDTAQLPTFYSGQGLGGGEVEGRASERASGGPFKVLMAHSGKMTPHSLLPSLRSSLAPLLLRPSGRRFYSFRRQSSYNVFPGVVAAPSPSSPRPPPFDISRSAASASVPKRERARAWFYGSEQSLKSWREVGDTVFNSAPGGQGRKEGRPTHGAPRSVGCLSPLFPSTSLLHFLSARPQPQTFSLSLFHDFGGLEFEIFPRR